MSKADAATLAAAERRFSDLNHVSVGLVVLDSDLQILFWNRSMEFMTGIDKATAVGRPIADLNPVWKLPHYMERLSQLFEGGPPVVFSPQLHPKIVPGPREQGLSFHVKATAVPAGDGWWAFLSVEDVTVLFRRVEELRVLRGQQERMMREIHHRVKNNLHMISGLITLQKEHGTSALDSGPFEDLQSRIAALSEIHDILYQSTTMTEGNTADYLTHLAKLVDKNLSVAETHRLVLEIDPQTVLKTDTTLLLGLIEAELMTNALKYGLGRQEAETLTIRLLKLAPGEWEYQLSHTGDRLPADFDPETSQGLGMVLLKAYTQQLGSRLEWARGDPTRFWLRFAE